LEILVWDKYGLLLLGTGRTSQQQKPILLMIKTLHYYNL
jgi:hypothetical protein